MQGLAEHKDTLGAPLCPCRWALKVHVCLIHGDFNAAASFSRSCTCCVVCKDSCIFFWRCTGYLPEVYLKHTCSIKLNVRHALCPGTTTTKWQKRSRDFGIAPAYQCVRGAWLASGRRQLQNAIDAASAESGLAHLVHLNVELPQLTFPKWRLPDNWVTS